MSRPGTFVIERRDPGGARAGRLTTAHGTVETPAFMPVGTQAAVKGMSPAELEELGYRMLLGNAYHLYDRPGVDIIERRGGLHAFMGWPHALLTDSGGFQVFSLAGLRRITADGVEFQSHRDGRPLTLGPESAMAIQRRLGSDIAMAFDECPPFPCPPDYACRAVERTLAWAARCVRQPRAAGQLVFGIVQGSVYPALRARCARELAAMPFDGYAVGGVSVGEGERLMFEGLDLSVPHLPEGRPRYAMGVGHPVQMVEAAGRGVDLFDCVMPTRYARNGTAFTRRGRYPVKAGRYRDDPRPIEEGCACGACRRFSRSAVRHFLNVDEILGVRLLTLHNLHRYRHWMAELRAAIVAGAYAAFRDAVRAAYRDGPDGKRAERESDGK